MEAVVTAWDDIDWERLQTRIETEINALGQRQDDSEERRKRLVEESNSYRQNTNKESRKPAIPLIKAFQQEFDGLLARSQYAETAFIDICSQITNLPDPKTLLKGAEAWKSDADKTKRAVEERESLKKKLQETQLELAELQNKDAELRQLKNTLVKKEFEQGKYLEDSLEEAEKRIRDEFISQLEEMNLKSEKIKAENEILEKKVNEMEAKNRETQRKLDVAKMANDQNEELENEQLAIALKDLNDANHRIVTLEQRLSELDAEMSQNNETSLKNGNGLADISAIGELMHEKDEQISKLCNEINQIEEKHEKELKFWKDKVSSLEREQKVQRGHVEDLKAQLDTRSDYEAIKKELRLLREIEFGSTAAERSETFGESVESLDRLLADKNRRLQNENASLRVLNDTYKDETNSTVRSEMPINRSPVLEKMQEEPELDLLSLLRKMKSPVTATTSTTTKHPTHTITTTALPYPALTKRVNLRDEEALQTRDSSPEEIDLKLSSVVNNGNTNDIFADLAEVEIIEKMQGQIQNNIKILGSRSLNTIEIARQCKRLMVAYNIGQRLFAKHVMNQVVKSQGSLSELLSKPRHWNKLTDKGREAFRRIYGWISDDTAIELLCSLSPRRIYPTEAKIEHPKADTLWESNSANVPEITEIKEVFPRVSSAREDQYRLAGSVQSASSRTFGTTPIRSSRWRHDDISKEKIKSIFETEMQKLKDQESVIDKSFGVVKPVHNRRSSDHISSDKVPVTTVEKLLRQRVNSGLLPVTQTEYDAHPALDTEQLVKQIKEFLTVNSISQRQFGENVLGLSQGSVSDLLARPKTWAQLTQKGREPFIRMKLFLQDVEKSNKDNKTEMVDSIRILDDDSELARTLANILNGQNGTKSVEDGDSIIDFNDDFNFDTDLNMKMESDGTSSRQDGANVEDSFEVVHSVKKVLDKNNISPKTFGDHYLKCSSTLLGDLLLRTKSYESARPAEKEALLKMKAFLTDPDALQMLIEHETMRDISCQIKMEPLVKSVSPPSAPRSIKRKGSSDSQDDEWEPKKPIQRTIITDFQKEVLRFVFVNEQHPSQELCEMLANRMDMSVRTVQNWFHNHRTRSKAREKEGKIYSDALPSDANAMKSSSWRRELDRMLASGASESESSTYSNKEDEELEESKDVVKSIISSIKSQTNAKLATKYNHSPTMVNFFSNNNLPIKKASPNIPGISSNSPSTSNGQKPSTSRTLDKLVANLRHMAEVKASTSAI